jgi:hypothetical protein
MRIPTRKIRIPNGNFGQEGEGRASFLKKEAKNFFKLGRCWFAATGQASA